MEDTRSGDTHLNKCLQVEYLFHKDAIDIDTEEDKKDMLTTMWYVVSETISQAITTLVMVNEWLTVHGYTREVLEVMAEEWNQERGF